MANDCIFCKIVSGDIPANILYQDEQVLAFHDISPQAPVHVLVIPKRHLDSLDTLTETDRPIIGHLMERLVHVARLLNVHQSGYRTILNTGVHGGQEVPHLHAHILGGKPIGPMVTR